MSLFLPKLGTNPEAKPPLALAGIDAYPAATNFFCILRSASKDLSNAFLCLPFVGSANTFATIFVSSSVKLFNPTISIESTKPSPKMLSIKALIAPIPNALAVPPNLLGSPAKLGTKPLE